MAQQPHLFSEKALLIYFSRLEDEAAVKLHCVICEGCFWRAAARASLRRPSHVNSDVCSNLLSGCSLHWGLLMGKGFEMSKRLKKPIRRMCLCSTTLFTVVTVLYVMETVLSSTHDRLTLSPSTPNSSFCVNGFKNKTVMLIWLLQGCCYIRGNFAVTYIPRIYQILELNIDSLG